MHHFHRVVSHIDTKDDLGALVLLAFQLNPSTQAHRQCFGRTQAYSNSLDLLGVFLEIFIECLVDILKLVWVEALACVFNLGQEVAMSSWALIISGPI